MGVVSVQHNAANKLPPSAALRERETSGAWHNFRMAFLKSLETK
jgi:hypothetical protein